MPLKNLLLLKLSVYYIRIAYISKEEIIGNNGVEQDENVQRNQKLKMG
jgi:hypothetical protein